MNISSLIEAYIKVHTSEKSSLQLLLQLTNEYGKRVCDRSFLPGHVTASGFVLSHDKKSTLLLYHKALQKFVQPGGHCALSDNDLLDVATREIYEETGLKFPEDLLLFHNLRTPIDIDIHTIPVNKSKNEPAHMHFDCRFLFSVRQTTPDIQLDHNESLRFHWVPLEEIVKDAHLTRVIRKIHKNTLIL